jgi:hypothetical protein
VSSPPRSARRATTRAALVAALLVLGACGADVSAGESDDEPTGSSPPTASTTTTTSSTSVPPTTSSSTSTSTTTAASTGPTLPLLPTTTTTYLDRSTDPPVPVADPGPPPGRNSVMVVGDSVFLGTARTIPLAMSHWLVTYDAIGSRRLARAVELFERRRNEIGEAVVIHLGNNYIEGERGSYASQIDEVMGLLWFVPRVVWVTVSEVNPGRPEINVAIREAATRWPNMRVAEWAPIIAANPQWSPDGLHLDLDGRRALAALVAETVGPVDEP